MTANTPVVRTRVWRLLQGAAVVGALAFAVYAIRGQWSALRAAQSELRPSWGYVFAASLLTLCTYAALVHAWRMLTAVGGTRLRYPVAVRIWSIANLGRYLPGKVWSIVALGVLARQAGVSPTTATTAAIAGTLINLGLGFAIVGGFGAAALDAMRLTGGRWLAWAVAGLTVVGLGVAPAVLPRVIRWFAARRGETALAAAPPPASTLWTVAAINAASWCAYGLAFRWLCLGIGVPGGDAGVMIAIFTASYLAGYLALPLPGGLVVRETALVAALTGLGVMGSADATLAAVSSRLWLTVLEVLPGCVALAIGSREMRDRAA
ncbi:MAG: flippase-like domain-containing protein [Gemmatimonadaceae bacterium]|nr:flippase-like domain-containing protein [Gemmatimonadaceae bacterium]